MEYKNRIIELTPQEQDDLDCGNFGDHELDEVIVDTDCLLSFKSSRLHAQNARLYGQVRQCDESQLFDPQVLRIRMALYELDLIRLERDANTASK